VNEVAASLDERWIVVSGILRRGARIAHLQDIEGAGHSGNEASNVLSHSSRPLA
jgi:hypothetical protein